MTVNLAINTIIVKIENYNFCLHTLSKYCASAKNFGCKTVVRAHKARNLLRRAAPTFNYYSRTP